MKGELRRYRWTNRAFLVAAVCYLSLVVVRESVPGQGEIFPVASWSLFTLVPNETHDYSLRILEADGQPLSPPIYFEYSQALFPSARTNGARVSIMHLGAALDRNDATAVAEIRRYLESLHLKGHNPLRYEVVARTYDPLERWRTGKIRSERTVATFDSMSPSSTTQGGR